MNQLEENDMPNVSEFTSIQTLFLFVLHKHPSMTGSEIVSMIESEIGKDWVPTAGATYKILKRLLKLGCIIETTETGNTDGRKRTYELSSCGRAFVKDQTERMLRLVGFFYDCCPEYATDYQIIKVCKPGDC